jgi:hypothetical protein
VKRIQRALAACAREIGAAKRRLRGLLLVVPETPQEDGLDPDEELILDLRGTIEQILEDDLDGIEKLLTVLDRMQSAIAQGWRGEREWRWHPERQPASPDR